MKVKYELVVATDHTDDRVPTLEHRRAYRRAQRAKRIARWRALEHRQHAGWAAPIRLAVGGFTVPYSLAALAWWIDEVAARRARTATPCSCYMCGHRRAIYGPSFNELRRLAALEGA